MDNLDHETALEAHELRWARVNTARERFDAAKSVIAWAAVFGDVTEQMKTEFHAAWDETAAARQEIADNPLHGGAS